MARTLRNILTATLAAALACFLMIGATGCSGSNGNGNGNAAPAANNAAAPANNAERAGAASSAKVVVGTLATEDILPFWVAEAEGMFEAAGVDAHVEVFQSATELIAGVTSGTVNFAMTDHMVTASIFASGTDVQIEWITLGTTPEQGRFGIMTADDSIKSLSDLAGQPIGVGSNTILEYVMDTLMSRAGIAQEDIVKEELQKLPVRYQTMASGQVKAAALPGALLALGEANGLTVVADDTAGSNISQSVMIMRGDFAKDDADGKTLAALKSVWDQAVAKINADPESYRELLVKKANLSDAVAATYPICEYPTCQLPEQSSVDDVLTWMDGKGYLSAPVAYNAADGTFTRK